MIPSYEQWSEAVCAQLGAHAVGVIEDRMTAANEWALHVAQWYLRGGSSPMMALYAAATTTLAAIGGQQAIDGLAAIADTLHAEAVRSEQWEYPA